MLLIAPKFSLGHPSAYRSMVERSRALHNSKGLRHMITEVLGAEIHRAETSLRVKHGKSFYQKIQMSTDEI